MCSSYALLLLPALFAAPLQHTNSMGKDLQNNDVVPLVPQPRTVFHMEFNENGTAKDEAPLFEVIPMEYLCDFCFAVIEMLKNMQNSDPNFEENMRNDCLNHTTEKPKNEVCGYVNKINLGRLKTETPSRLCLEEQLCLSENTNKIPQKSKDKLPTDTTSTSQQHQAKLKPKFINKTVTLNLVVDDIAK